VHLAADHVLEADVAARHFEADGEHRAAFRWIREAAPRVLVGPLLRLRLPALGLKRLSCAVAAVSLTLPDQPRRLFLIEVQALRLAVGRMRAALVRSLVPVEPQPVQALVDQRLVLGTVALDVGVIDAQDERSVLLAREEHVVERGAGGSEVREPRRAGRDPDANGHRHILRTWRYRPVCWRSSEVT